MASRVFMCLFAVMHAVSLFLFIKGFFLTRYEVQVKSSCENILPLESTLKKVIDRSEIATKADCLINPSFEKVVFVLIDALRFDFALWDSRGNSPGSEYYKNHLPILREVLERQPNNSLLFQIVADPPTTTMQRLKGLVTGGLPTFIDMRHNFDSPAIEEDSWVEQLLQHGKRVVFMGDDTWESLFPGKFTRSFPYPSFNVKDLNTVDSGIREHLAPEILASQRIPQTTLGAENKGMGQWDVIIAHFLGIDHVGHRYYANHPAMKTKLEEMNEVLVELINVVGNDTILFVLGDHGMTEDGNHGGAADIETGSALFAYSPRGLFDLPNEFRQILSDKCGTTVSFEACAARTIGGGLRGGALEKYLDRDEESSVRKIKQIDIVPTLSLLSGVPIPFGNLGSIIPEFFFGIKHEVVQAHTKDFFIERLRSVNAALALNVAQVKKYLDFYDQSAQQLADSSMSKLDLFYSQAELAAKELLDAESATQHLALFQILTEYLRFAGNTCRAMWTSFNIPNMIIGLFTLSITLATQIFVVWSLYRNQTKDNINLSKKESKDLAMSRPTRDSFEPERIIGMLKKCFIIIGGCLMGGVELSAIIGLIVVSLLVSIIFDFLLPKGLNYSKSESLGSKNVLQGCGMVIITLSHLAGMFTNSYIQSQDKAISFFSVSAFLILAIDTIISGHSTGASQTRIYRSAMFLCAAVLIRVSQFVGGPYNQEADAVTIHKTVLPMILTCVMFWLALKWTDPILTDGISKAVVFCVVPISTILSFIYFSLRYYGDNEAFSTTQRVILPRVVYCICIFSVVIVLMVPMLPFVGVDPEKVKSRSLIHSRCRRLSILFLFYPPIALVLGPASPACLFCLFMHVFIVAFGLDDRQKEGSPLQAWLYWLLSWHYFFATGHNNNFSSVQYAAGFVGVEEFDFYLSGGLVLLNTLASPLVFTLALPILFSTQPKFTLSAQDELATANLSHSSSIRQRLSRNSYVSALSVEQEKEHSEQSFDGERKQSQQMEILLLQSQCMHSLNLAASMLCVFIMRRHLMVWAIFAPKFAFDVIWLISTNVFSLFIGLCIRIH